MSGARCKRSMAQQNELAEEDVVDAVEVAIADVASILAVLDVAIVARAR